MASCESLVKNLSRTLKKLNGKNYLLWSQSLETFMTVHRKIQYLIYSPLDVKDAVYEDWYADNSVKVS